MKKLLTFTLLCAIIATSCSSLWRFYGDKSVQVEKDQVPESLSNEAASQENIDDGLPRVRLKEYVTGAVWAAIYGAAFGAAIYLFFFRKSYRKTLVSCVLFLCLLPGFWRTFLFATDTRWLITLNAMRADEFAYSDTAFILGPGMAFSILTNMPWLHSECAYFSKKLNWCDRPLISVAGGVLNVHEGDDNERQYLVLNWLVENGADVNARESGLPLIHQAILFRDSQYLKFLIDAGADPSRTIHKPDKPYDGYTPLQYMEYLESKRHSDFSEIRMLLGSANN